MKATPFGGGGGPRATLRIGLDRVVVALVFGAAVLSGCGAATDAVADTTTPLPVESSADDTTPASTILQPAPDDTEATTLAPQPDAGDPSGDDPPLADTIGRTADDDVAITFPKPADTGNGNVDVPPVYVLDPMPKAFSEGAGPRLVGYEPAWDMHASADPNTQGFHNWYGGAKNPDDLDAMAEVWYVDANWDYDWIEGRRCTAGSGADEHSEIVVDGGITAQACTSAGGTTVEWLLTGPAVPPGMDAGAVVRVNGRNGTDRAQVIELAQSLRSQSVDVPRITDQNATDAAGDATRLVLVADPMPASWVPLVTGHPFLTQDVDAFTWLGTTGSDGAMISYEFWVTTYVGVDNADEIMAALTTGGDFAQRTVRGHDALVQESGKGGRANMHVVWAEDEGTVVSVTSLLAGPRNRVMNWIDLLEPVVYPTSSS